MSRVFSMKLEGIQPSQLYISSAKLAYVMARFDSSVPKSVEPVPIKRLGGDVIYTDGHTRALAAFLCGLSEVMVFWDQDELVWEMYEICGTWCKEEGIHSIADLNDRVVGSEDYEILWLARCARMQHDLLTRRKRE